LAAYTLFGTVPLQPPDDGAAAVVVPAFDAFADPPAVAVRDDVLAQVGAPEPVRAGALADLVARIEAAGHEVERRNVVTPRRRPTPTALCREGSARLWLFRRHPERFPLPRPGEVGWLRYPLLALGALRANARPPDKHAG
jgi:hypothetical protein